MLRRIGWTLPLLLGALACCVGCTFPKSFGFARKQPPESQSQVAEESAAAAPSDTKAAPRATSLVQALRRPVDWLSAKRRQPEPADPQALAGKAGDSSAGSQPLSYPNVVPSKYRDMDAGVSKTSVASDAAGTPSLVRPSRRPPPDPAPKPPLADTQESLWVKNPPAENPLHDIIAAATRSWRVDEPAVAPRTPGDGGAAEPASDRAAPPQLVTDTHLKFTPPDLSVREQKQVRTSLDIATNILRPAKPATQMADPSAMAAVPGEDSAPRAEVHRPTLPSTTWVAKKNPPSSTAAASGESPPATAAGAPQVPAAAVASAGATTSTVVANTFGNPAGKLAPGHGASPTQAPTPRTERVPAPKPVHPLVTIPDRTEAVARAEAARTETLPRSRPTYLAKTPSHARPSVPTQAAAPPAAIEQETLAPLVDANTYRAQLASTPGNQATPVRTAARESSPPTPGSWVAAYERLLQNTDATPASHAPVGSPTRRLRSDDAPALPQPAAPTLRR